MDKLKDILRKKGLFIATNNNGKLTEFESLLKPLAISIFSPSDFGITDSPKETGTTFQENSAQKVLYYFKKAGIPTLADDSGLVVDALNGEPGVFSARYGGEHLGDRERNHLILKKLAPIPSEKRTARFECVISLTMDGIIKNIKYYYGRVEGIISKKERGKNGFGYDPIFFIPEKNKTFAELSSEEKNKMSHRGRAIKSFIEAIDVL